MTTKATEKKGNSKEEHTEEETRHQHAPAPETVDQTKEGERLMKEDRERFDKQGDKGAAD